MASRRGPSGPNNSTPFHVAARRAREARLTFQSALASQAGVTIGVYNAMELGQAPVSRAVYDAVIHFFPQLKTYPRPGVDPVLVTPTIHPVIDMEHRRIQSFHDMCLKLNVGTTNRGIVGEMLRLALSGALSLDDILRYFP